MNRTLRLVGLAVALATPTLLAAQVAGTRQISFGASAGLSMPTGDLGDGSDAGYAVAGHVFYRPASMQALRLRGDVSFDRWGVKNTNESADASRRSLGFVANVLYDFASTSEGNIRPYVIGGLGLYNYKTSVDVAGVNLSDSSTDVGIQAGGGLQFQLSGFSTFAEVKYVNVFSDNSISWVPITFGIRF
jgi:opacity protein-like surface antigen